MKQVAKFLFLVLFLSVLFSKVNLQSANMEYEGDLSNDLMPICIVENTLITMADETKLKVDRLVKGDKIKGYNIASKKFIDCTVKNINKSAQTRMARMRLENGMELIQSMNLPVISSIGWVAINEKQVSEAKYGSIRGCAIGDDVLYYDIIGSASSPIELIQGLTGVKTAYSIEVEADEDIDAIIANQILIGL